jgi:peptide/nickel transport system permease protein
VIPLRYLIRRLLAAVVVLFGVLVVTFLVARIIPADSARLYAGGAKASPAQVAEARIELGLDKPLVVQFGIYLEHLSRGDFGISFRTRRPIGDDIRQFLPASLELVIPSMGLALLIGIPVGVMAAARRGHVLDAASRVASISGAALPSFWVALLIQLLFGTAFHVLPISGQNSDDIIVLDPIKQITGFNLLDALVTANWNAVGDTVLHMILPVMVLTIYPVCLTIRMTRAAVLEALSETYVLAARASGLRESTILFRLTLKNAIVPTLTVLGLTFASAFTGTVLIEIIFGWPGVGRYLTEAIADADFPVILAVTTIGTLAYILINLLVDLTQAVLDPRIRLDA